MVSTVASSPSINASPVVAPVLAGAATCPSCHTADLSLTDSAVTAGADWRCRRCGQQWDAGRLTKVAAYAVWESERASAATRANSLKGDA